MNSVSMRMTTMLQEHNLLTEDVIVSRLSEFLEQQDLRIEAETVGEFAESFELLLSENKEVAQKLAGSAELTELWKTLAAGLGGAVVGGLLGGPVGALAGAKLGVAARAAAGAYRAGKKVHDKIQDYRLDKHSERMERARRRYQLARAPHELADLEKSTKELKAKRPGEDDVDLSRHPASIHGGHYGHGGHSLHRVYDDYHRLTGEMHHTDPRLAPPEKSKVRKGGKPKVAAATKPQAEPAKQNSEPEEKSAGLKHINDPH